MNEDEKTEEEVVVPVTTEEQVEQSEVETSESTEQDPLKIELEKVERKGRSKAEKLLYTKKRVEEQLKELGIEEEPEDDEENTPVTIGMLKKLQAQTATKTALDMADEITNVTERGVLRYHLENTIRSTGNPQEDFKLAQGLVNSVKNSQIIEETIRKVPAKTHGSGGGVPAKVIKEPEYSAEELQFMKPPFNMSREEILAARQ